MHIHIYIYISCEISIEHSSEGLASLAQLWHQVGMNLIGPLTETPRGNKYIVTITDYFSKWAEAGPLPNKHAHGIAKFFYSNVSQNI